MKKLSCHRGTLSYIWYKADLECPSSWESEILVEHYVLIKVDRKFEYDVKISGCFSLAFADLKEEKNRVVTLSQTN